MEKLICDPELLELISYKNITQSQGYPCITVNKRTVKLHHLILPVKPGFDVDHKNRNKWDCRRENLRYLTRSENSLNAGKQINNTSGYKGVSFNKKSQNYDAYLTVNKTKYRTYGWATAEEARASRLRLELKYLPEYLINIE